MIKDVKKFICEKMSRNLTLCFTYEGFKFNFNMPINIKHNYRTLILDGNSTARGDVWHELLERESNSLIKLSLWHYGITGSAVRRIGGSLGNTFRSLNIDSSEFGRKSNWGRGRHWLL